MKKQEDTEKKDLYLLERIQPAGGILFKDETYVRTGSGYECCIHIYEFPGSVLDNWLTTITEIKDTIVSVDIGTDDITEVKKNINKSLKEQTSRYATAKDFNERYDAQQRATEMKTLYHEISTMKEIVKIITIRIYLMDRTLIALEEKVSKLMNYLESMEYKPTIYLNETQREWLAMYRSYTEQQEEPFSVFGQAVQSTALANGNPFHFSSLEDETGAYLGYTSCGGNMIFDIFTKTDTRLYYNAACFGTMGSGKSTLLKKLFSDRAARGDFVRAFDISGEFTNLTLATGGKVIKLGNKESILNPFEILRAGDNETVNFQIHNSKLTTIYRYLSPEASHQEVIVFSNMVRELYKKFNLLPEKDGKEMQITGLPSNQYPIFSDFLELLEDSIKEISTKEYSPINLEIAKKNVTFLDTIRNTIENVVYTFGTVLNGHTTIDNILHEKIVTFDISDLKEMQTEIFDAVIFNMFSLCYDNCVANGQRMERLEAEGKITKRDKIKTMILIDESHRWINTQKVHALKLVLQYFREARKYHGGIVMASQSIRDYVPEGSSSEAISQLKNLFELTQYKFILHQDANALDTIDEVFKHTLTPSQINRIPKLEMGDAILAIASDKNYEFHVKITEEERKLFNGGD